MTKPETKRAAKPTRKDIDHMAAMLCDQRINSAGMHRTLAPNLGVDPDLDIAEADYRLAVEAFARED